MTFSVRAVIHDDRNTRGRETNSRILDEGSGSKVSYSQLKCVRYAAKHNICIWRFVARDFP